MAPLPDRKALEAMKRIDVQKLCKDYGVKANLKTEALIDLLLDASQPRPPKPAPQRSASIRISSSAGARGRGRSGGSMIIHDTDDEDQEADEEDPEPAAPEPHTVSKPTPASAPRTRKAKELQTRLGVGRPVAAGGSGARTITRSISVSRSKRGKSKSMKVVEATIPEESEEPAALPITELHRPTFSEQATNLSVAIDPPDAGPSGTNHDGHIPQEPTVSNVGPSSDLGNIDQHVKDALRPIHEQIQSFGSHLEQLQSLQAEVKQLTARLADMDDLRRKVHTLTVELADVRAQSATMSELNAEMKQLKETIVGFTSLRAAEKARSRGPSTPLSAHLNKKVSGSGPSVPTAELDVLRSNFAESQTGVASTSGIVNPHPGLAPTTLGKRHRDSVASDLTGVIEEGQEGEFSQEEFAKRVLRHTKKRAKFSLEQDDMASGKVGETLLAETSDQPQAAATLEEEEEFESVPAPRVPSFTVFNDLEEPPENYLDPPPPTTHLPEFFAPPSPPGSRPTTSTAHASENHHPFTFSFLPTSAPANSMNHLTMPSFPYPEAPQSPSPAGLNTTIGFPRHPEERRHHHDLFRSFLVPKRPGSAAATDAPGGFINPAALTRPSERGVSSNDVAAGLGLTAVRIGSDSESEHAVPAMKKTMYGTELDGDTRFGDFGVEGVASGFWASKY